MAICEYCGEEFEKTGRNQKYCCMQCNHSTYYYKHREKCLELTRKWEEKNIKKRRKYRRKWHIENREKERAKRKRYYYKNKDRELERAFVSRHRSAILKLLPKYCHRCGKKWIKEIHHITYTDLPKRKMNPTRKEMEEYLKIYCKYLLGFCSLECHRKYEIKERIKKRKEGK